MDHGDQLLHTAAEEALERTPRARLLATLEADPKLRQQVVWLLAHFATDHGPHFLAALSAELADAEEPSMALIEPALAKVMDLPALQIREMMAEQVRAHRQGQGAP